MLHLLSHVKNIQSWKKGQSLNVGKTEGNTQVNDTKKLAPPVSASRWRHGELQRWRFLGNSQTLQQQQFPAVLFRAIPSGWLLI